MSVAFGALALDSEIQLLDAAEGHLRQRLPAGWEVTIDSGDNGESRGTRVDGWLRIKAPGSEERAIPVEVKRTLEPRDVSSVVETLMERWIGSSAEPALVVAKYLASSVRDKLSAAGMSYVDATGNVRLEMGDPALFVSDRGADKDPWRGPGRPKGDLKGAPAAAIVRSLCDRPGPWRMRELIEVSRVSAGSVYRVVDFLEAQDLVAREGRGGLAVKDWAEVLRRWSVDYRFLETNSVTSWLAPRGIEDVIERAVADGADDYAVTGSAAASTWSEYAPTRSLMLYADRPAEIADRWGLRSVDSGVNVLVAAPAFPALTRGALIRGDGLRIAAPAQVAADLLTGPGRAPAEGEDLIGWMQANEELWR
ncbi:hypothetical protein [Brevibacterium spongiae]|uniref:HTH iclR-type domain-containing protein n=1 Tax=Brevibacterium spongiae TaxID=2909672 RepID=A0ABY5SPU2_9MICO|nr:hypothetical protein [Brevibacterium spongiae]UVI36570.1 hypothetical protein L1F31_02565 [Brevibacterium spongiae]